MKCSAATVHSRLALPPVMQPIDMQPIDMQPETHTAYGTYNRDDSRVPFLQTEPHYSIATLLRVSLSHSKSHCGI